MTLLYTRRRSKMRSMALVFIAALSAISTTGTAATQAAPLAEAATLDQGALIRELTLTHTVEGKLTMSMWMPDEFWRIALKSSGRMTDKGIADFIGVMHPYILVAVMDAQKGITAFRYTDTDTLVNETTIEDSHGNIYRPLAPDSVAEDVRNLIQTMRPLLANMMGNMGQHMEFLVFPSMDNDGHLVADPMSDGALTLHVGDAVMRYRLPIGSMLPPSLDPKTGESFPGSYHFNPYTGGKLVQRPSDTHAAPVSKPQ
jgi:hypothetical protein